MARTAGKKQAPAKVEEEDDTEGWDDAVVETDAKGGGVDLRLRDWRDVERFREMKDLRRLVDDDYGLEEIFHVPPRRPEMPPRTRLGVPARPAAAPARPAPGSARARNEGAPPPKGPAKPVKVAAPAKLATRAAARPHQKPAAKPAKAKAKARPKRR
jgi:hypothetical protein